jgi:hypothetical protein
MSETEEKIKKDYETQDEKVMSAKIRGIMLEIIKLDDPADGYPIFKYVRENFTEGEMAHVVCVYAAKQMAELIQKDPQFKALCSMLKTMDTIQKKAKDEH